MNKAKERIKYLVVYFMTAYTVFMAMTAPSYSQSSIIAPGATLELLATGFKFTEGPAVDKKGNVYFTDQPTDRILIWRTDNKISTFLQKAGRANGLSFDSHGNLWACADEKNELWRISPQGYKTIVVKDYRNALLNGPNDIWILPNDGVYFTDPFYRRPYWKHRPAVPGPQCVYYLDPTHKVLTRVTNDLKQPNGIIGTPDGNILYVSDIGDQKTYQYNIQPDGSLTGKELFCEMGSDGMTIDSKGNVYLTGTGVTVFNPEGNQIEHINVNASWTANVCFGGRDRKTLFITASENLFGLKMQVTGVGSQ